MTNVAPARPAVATDAPPRVLVIAEAANPSWVSVPLVGWSHSRALAEVADTLVVTQVRNRDAILATGLEEGRDFCAIDSEAVAARVHRLATALRGGGGVGWTTVTALAPLSYYYFEHLLWKRFGRAIRAGEFDVVHRVTPLSPTTPSIIGGRCAKAGVPFVVGPLNGGLPWPDGFREERHREREWLSYLRSLHRLLPGFSATRRHASALIIASDATMAQLDPESREKAVYIPENGIDPALFGSRVSRPPSLPVRVAFIGRLVPYKGADMLLEAAAPLVRDGKLEIDVLGDGPEMEKLRSMRAELELGSAVRLDGWVEHAKLSGRLLACDVLGFPSVREFGGGVVLEAMAVGLCPVVLAYGGPGELVTPETGYRIPMGSRDEIVQRLREVFREIVAAPHTARERGERARLRAHSQFSWSAKAAQVRQVYDWVTGRRSTKPDPGLHRFSPCAPGSGEDAQCTGAS